MPEFERIISSLPPDMQGILRQLAAGGAGLTASQLLGLLARLIAAATDTQRATIWRAMMWLANAGRVKLSVLIEAAEMMAAGETAGLEAAASSAGGGGAAAGGGAALTLAGIIAVILAIILAMEALAIAYYAIEGERGIIDKVAPQGRPCSGTGPTGTVFTKWVRRFGSKTSRNAAISAAMTHARQSMTCSGNCSEDPDGPACTPVAIPISVIPRSRIIFTTTTITYRVGCACL